MKKCFLSILLCFYFFGFSQEKQTNLLQIEGDSIVYNKNTNIEEQRTFNDNLKDKYNGKEFTYVDDIKKPKKPKKKKTSSNSSVIEFFVFFMKVIFPILLGLAIVIIILKVFLGSETGFWSFKKTAKKTSEKLIFEDEDIHESDFDALLQKAIKEKNYRLATRYYYLSLLKKLTDKKEIEYHKDKTNTEYLFEITNKDLRNQFSKVSYIYSYVWYGEFPLDSAKFKTVENSYKTIFKSIN